LLILAKRIPGTVNKRFRQWPNAIRALGKRRSASAKAEQAALLAEAGSFESHPR
jgi:hypothetical protein